MKTKFIQYLILLFLITVSVISCAQQPIQINLSGKEYIISEFKEDSVQSFNNPEVQNNVIYPIKESKALIEIRLYTYGLVTTIGKVNTIMIFKDTVIADNYRFRYYDWRPVDDYEYVGKDKYGNGGVGRIHKTLIVKQTAQNIVESLIDNKIFAVDDGRKYLDSLKKIGNPLNEPLENCIDCASFVLCEIKVGKKYRNLYLFTRGEDYLKTNPSNEYLENQTNIFKLFSDIFKK